MKSVIKQILKEEELKIEEFFVSMCVENGREMVIEFADSSTEDAGNGLLIGNDYGRYYIILHELKGINHNTLMKLGFPSSESAEHTKNTYLEQFLYYDGEYGDFSQDQLSYHYLDEDGNPVTRGYQHPKNPHYSEWVDYADFHVADNKNYIRILNREVDIVEYHVSIIKADDSRNMMSQLTDD